MSSPTRVLTIRLTDEDADLVAALAQLPRGQRSEAIRSALRAWFCGPSMLRHLLEAVSQCGGVAERTVSVPTSSTLPEDTVVDFLEDFLGSSRDSS
jgi:Arc/MetJ-type ribon-helix-helix transcriptional regulator